MTMKRPEIVLKSMQSQNDARLNPFAIKLLAESFADVPERFGDKTVVVTGRAHNGTVVWMLISTQQPDAVQFENWP